MMTFPMQLLPFGTNSPPGNNNFTIVVADDCTHRSSSSWRDSVVLVSASLSCLWEIVSLASELSASGVIIGNTRFDLISPSSWSELVLSFPIPLIFVELDASTNIVSYLKNNATVSATLEAGVSFSSSDYYSPPNGLWIIDITTPDTPMYVRALSFFPFGPFLTPPARNVRLSVQTTEWFDFAAEVFVESTRPYLYVAGVGCTSDNDSSSSPSEPSSHDTTTTTVTTTALPKTTTTRKITTSPAASTTSVSHPQSSPPSYSPTYSVPPSNGPPSTRHSRPRPRREAQSNRFCHGGFLMFDISTPATPVLVAEWDHAEVNSVKVQLKDNRSILCATASGTSNVYIMDVTNPETIGNSVLTFQATNGSEVASSSFLGDILFVTHQEAGAPISIWNTTDLLSIEEVGQVSVNSSGGTVPSAALVQGSLLWVSYFSEGILLYNVTDPTSPTVLAWYDSSSFTSGFHGVVALFPSPSNRYALACDLEQGLLLVQYVGTIPQTSPDTVSPPSPTSPTHDNSPDMTTTIIFGSIGAFVVGAFSMMVIFYLVSKDIRPAGYIRVTPTSENQASIELT